MMGHQSLANNTAKYYINVIFHARHFYDYDEVLLKHYLIKQFQKEFILYCNGYWPQILPRYPEFPDPDGIPPPTRSLMFLSPGRIGLVKS